MARFIDYYSDAEVKTIMEKFISRFPSLFEGFNVDLIHVIVTKKKKSRVPARLIPVRYPYDVYVQKPYIVEVFEELWTKMDVKRRNMAVWHVMCAIPEGAFDETSTHYGKKVRPDINMYLQEFVACGGVPNWMENPDARDPMDIIAEDSSLKTEEDSKDAKDGVSDGSADDVLPPDVKAPADAVIRVPVTIADIASVGVEK